GGVRAELTVRPGPDGAGLRRARRHARGVRHHRDGARLRLPRGVRGRGDHPALRGRPRVSRADARLRGDARTPRQRVVPAPPRRCRRGRCPPRARRDRRGGRRGHRAVGAARHGMARAPGRSSRRGDAGRKRVLRDPRHGTIYYLAHAVNEDYFPRAAEVWAVAVATILVTILVHGVTATPVLTRLDRRRAGRAAGTG